MDYSNRQEPLEQGRRISLNVNLSPDILEELAKIADGNRSKAIEILVRQHIARSRRRTTATALGRQGPSDSRMWAPQH
jgi:hypothetical protein